MPSFTEIITTPVAAYRIELSVAGPHRVDVRILISTARDSNGKPSGWKLFHTDRNQDLNKAGHRDALRRKLNIPPEQDSVLLDIIEKFEAWLKTDANKPDTTTGDFTVTVKGMYEGQSKMLPVCADTPFNAIKKALSLSPSELPDQAVIFVPENLDNIAFLDIDYHDIPLDDRPDPRDLDTFMDVILPRGDTGWISHGRGIKMVFVRDGNFSAKILADCAAVYALSRDPLCAVEVMHHARHPLSIRNNQKCGPIRQLIPDHTIGILGAFSRMACPPDIAEKWRQENSIVVGERYGHDKCPIDPQHISQSPIPVVALDGGLYCHSCMARSSDGFRSWGSLAGLVSADNDNPIYSAARHLAHWDQVQYLFRELQ